jgi:hypothetical protein
MIRPHIEKKGSSRIDTTVIPTERVYPREPSHLACSRGKDLFKMFVIARRPKAEFTLSAVERAAIFVISEAF